MAHPDDTTGEQARTPAVSAGILDESPAVSVSPEKITVNTRKKTGRPLTALEDLFPDLMALATPIEGERIEPMELAFRLMLNPKTPLYLVVDLLKTLMPYRHRKLPETLDTRDPSDLSRQELMQLLMAAHKNKPADDERANASH